MDFSNDILIVDIANIRDDDPEHGKTRMREGRRVRMSSIPYIDSALLALQVQVPAATILKIADYSLQYNFPDSEKQEFLRRTNLELTDPSYIYLLPLQPKKEQKKRGLFLRKSADDTNFVEADDIILVLAAELDAFAISGDSFMDEKFNRRMKSMRDRLFVHHYSRETDSWWFVSSKEYFSINRNMRDDWDQIKSLTTIAQRIGVEKSFDDGSDFDIRDFAFNTLIEEFWASKKVQITVHQKRKLTSLPFRNVLPSVLTTPAPVKAVQVIGVAGSHPLVSLPSREVERVPVPVVAQKTLKATAGRTDLALPSFYAAAVPSILKHEGENIAVLGMLVRDDGDLFVEWVLSNLRIQIVSDSFEEFPRHGEIVRITGVIQKNGEKVSLHYGSNDFIVPVSFTELVQKRIKAARTSELRRLPSKWSLPPLRWGLIRQRLPGISTQIKPILPPKPNWPTPDFIPPQLVQIKNKIPTVEPDLPLLDWFDERSSEETNDLQLLTMVNSQGEVEFLDLVPEDKKVLNKNRLWKVLFGIVLIIASAFVLYFLVIKDNSSNNPWGSFDPPPWVLYEQLPSSD